MDLVAVMGPLVALIGVWLGGWLASRSARQNANVDLQRRSLEDLRRIYSAYLTTCRQFADYLKQPANKVEIVRSVDGALEVPLLNPDGAALRQAVEAASADILLTARSPATVERARQLRVATIKFALARARSADGIVPHQDVVAFRAAEQAYVDAARLDLGMSTMDISLWTSPPETSQQ